MDKVHLSDVQALLHAVDQSDGWLSYARMESLLPLALGCVFVAMLSAFVLWRLAKAWREGSPHSSWARLSRRAACGVAAGILAVWSLGWAPLGQQDASLASDLVRMDAAISGMPVARAGVPSFWRAAEARANLTGMARRARELQITLRMLGVAQQGALMDMDMREALALASVPKRD